MSFTQSLRDPVIYAIPVFAAFMALEVLSLKFLDDDDADDSAEGDGPTAGRERPGPTNCATPAPTSSWAWARWS